jgi:ectoine hydroxylase-related dioxygenase (phytanoyl-CoA dioxygenase family)
MNSDGIVLSGQAGDANAQFYRQQGYLVVPDLLGSAEVAELRQETVEIFRGQRGRVRGLLNVAGLADADVLKQYVAIHFPHKISELIRRYLQHPGVVGILRRIVSPNVKCMQSMLFVKAPGKAGQSWHQDEYYIPTRDRSLVGAWIALDDADVDNGCLQIIPGSNTAGHIMRRVAGSSPEFAESDTIDVSGYDARTIVPVEVKRGSVVFFGGHTLHSSTRNKTHDRFRMALVNHYMSAESMLPWDQDGRQPLTEDLRDIVMVAGEDPYAWKGVVDVHRPFLRAEAPKPRP